VEVTDLEDHYNSLISQYQKPQSKKKCKKGKRPTTATPPSKKSVKSKSNPYATENLGSFKSKGSQEDLQNISIHSLSPSLNSIDKDDILYSDYITVNQLKYKVLLINYAQSTILKIFVFKQNDKRPKTLLVPFHVFQKHFDCANEVLPAEFKQPNVYQW
jgi:hypothetical protein